MKLSGLLLQLERVRLLRLVLLPARKLWRWQWSKRVAWLARHPLHGRAKMVLCSPDLDLIDRVPGAGRVIGQLQIMHNGLLIQKGCYYGPESIAFFRRTRGVHEPQEERVFAQMLPRLPTGTIMVELGSYWAFYSMWCARVVPGSRCHLVEPDAANLAVGRQNFALNGLTPASCTHAYIAGTPGRSAAGIRIMTLPELVAEQSLPRIHLLHADIQSHELDMLQGAKPLFQAGLIDCLFISTHSEKLHSRCRSFLLQQGLLILTDVTPAHSYSCDGLLVARNAHFDGPSVLPVALRPSSSRR